MKRANILWVVTTQWRAQACGYAGDLNARTPALDALASCAFNYTQAVTPHPFGPFARAALLTGVPSPQNGVRDYFDPLPLRARTIAHELAERDFATAFFGKWHLWKRDAFSPLVGEAHAKIIVPPEARGGFAFWEGFESGFALNNPWLHGTRLAEPVRFDGYQSDVLCERATSWCEWAGSNPRSWFCLLSLEPPHPPYDAQCGETGPRPEALLLAANVPRGGKIEERARRELAGYYAQITATDRAIGEMLKRIGAQDRVRSERTLVVFTSVHGDMHGAHGLFRKGWPHEESVRVPLLVRLPGGQPEGRPEAISLVELPRRTLAFVDTGIWDREEAQEAEISMPSVVALPLQCDRVWRGLRSKNRKLVYNADGSPWLSFNLQTDPGEERSEI